MTGHISLKVYHLDWPTKMNGTGTDCSHIIYYPQKSNEPWYSYPNSIFVNAELRGHKIIFTTDISHALIKWGENMLPSSEIFKFLYLIRKLIIKYGLFSTILLHCIYKKCWIRVLAFAGTFWVSWHQLVVLHTLLWENVATDGLPPLGGGGK